LKKGGDMKRKEQKAIKKAKAESIIASILDDLSFLVKLSLLAIWTAPIAFCAFGVMFFGSLFSRLFLN
jgi:hypothetical protein